ncbi:cadherin-related family member 5 [Struthio camelus]|uniref:cadherin-related family member 5 n=1 Tax=Struthio camelus TaxID=8801 RepID=UPI003603DD3F
MAFSHRFLTSMLFLLPSTIHVLAQQEACSVDNQKPSVNENNPPGYVVTTITLEQGFTVRIDPSSPDASYFTIQGSQLQLTKSVDFEKDTLLLVYLLCSDAAGQSNSLEIIVTIVNMNDNSPVFKQTNLTQIVPEDTKVNSTVIPREDLSATDADLDTIYYELTTRMPDTDGYFAIKGVNNPEIYLRKALDYDKIKFTTLLLYARDRPVNSTNTTHTATATISIFIEQADTKPPWFLPCTFTNMDNNVCISSPYTGRVNISEKSTAPLTLAPGPIYAIDPDYTLNEKIVYSIVGGDTDKVFSVDADTGNLTMNKAVTSPDPFLLQVMASQVNNVQKYSVVSVEIKVINKSDSAPYFKNKIYKGTVSVGLAPGSFVLEADVPSKPLMITAADDDFTDKVNPNIEYHIRNSTDFIATKDGLILTNVMLESPGTVTMEALGKDTVSLQEVSTVIEVEVVPATAESSSDKRYTARDMGVLGGTLAAPLLIALIFLGLMIYKQCGKPVKYLARKKFSKNLPRDYQNQAYKEDEYPDVSAKQHETAENGSVRSMTSELEQPSLPSPSSKAREADGLPTASTASTITFDPEDKEEEVEEENDHEKEVKSILKTDRNLEDNGYKAVWFKSDVEPDAGDGVEVIEDNAAADDDEDSDQDLEENEEEKGDYNEDSHHGGPGLSFALESQPLPGVEVKVNMSGKGTAAEDDSEFL